MSDSSNIDFAARQKAYKEFQKEIENGWNSLVLNVQMTTHALNVITTALTHLALSGHKYAQDATAIHTSLVAAAGEQVGVAFESPKEDITDAASPPLDKS